MLRCSACKQDLPEDAFSLRRRTARGRNEYCRVCLSARNRARYAADPEAHRATRRESYLKHREAELERARKWRVENPDAAHERDRAANQADPGKFARWYEANRDLILRRNRESRAVNVDRFRDRDRRRREANIEAYRAYARESQHKRRAAKKATCSETRPYSEVLYGDPCAYCGEPATTVDHIAPLSSGGAHEWGNLTAACLSCNSSKGAKPLLSFLLGRA